MNSDEAWKCTIDHINLIKKIIYTNKYVLPEHSEDIFHDLLIQTYLLLLKYDPNINVKISTYLFLILKKRLLDIFPKYNDQILEYIDNRFVIEKPLAIINLGNYFEDIDFNKLENGEISVEELSLKVNEQYFAFNKLLTIDEWLKEPECIVIKKLTIINRLNAGYTFIDAITLPARRKAIQYFGYNEEKIIKEWLNDPRCTVKRGKLYYLLNSGKSIEEIFKIK